MFEHLDDPTPPTGDPDLALTRGSQLTRRRRTLLAGTALCAVVALGAGAVALAPSGQRRDTLSPADSGPASTQTATSEPVQDPSVAPTPNVAPTAIVLDGPEASATPTATFEPIPDFGAPPATQKCGPLLPSAPNPVPGLSLTMQLTSSPVGEFGFGWNVRLVVRNVTDHDVTFYPVDVRRNDLGQVLRPDGRTLQGGDVNSTAPDTGAERVVLSPGGTWELERGVGASNGVTEDVQGNPTPTGCDLQNGPHRIRTALSVGVSGHQVLWWPASVAVTVVGVPQPTPSPTPTASASPSPDPTPTAG